MADGIPVGLFRVLDEGDERPAVIYITWNLSLIVGKNPISEQSGDH